MKFRLFTLIPEMFPGNLGFSLAGEALSKGLWNFETVNIRNFGLGNYNHVDDTPYGGGAGMVLRPDVLEKALESVNEPLNGAGKKAIYMSPRGKPLTQQKAQELAQLDTINILCGRFEGVDERVLEHYELEEISIGDYVLSGGEPAALILMDAVIRLIPEVLGNPETHSEESFSNGLLEYPQYTRPAEWKGKKVPDILASGNHAKIAEWRKQKSIEITQERRPDLLKK